MFRAKERRFEGYAIKPLMDKYQGQRVRIWPLTVLLLIAIIWLWTRLFQLTIVEGSWRRKLAEDNRILVLPVAAERGVLLDRDGQALTQNVPVYRRQKPGTGPASLAFESVDRDQALKLLADPTERISYSIDRIYPCGQACAPIVGYVAQVTEDELVKSDDYRLGDLVGRVGAEKVFERRLMGAPGEEFVEVNAAGMAVRTVGETPAQAGSSVNLSISMGLQKVMYEAMGDYSGAAVALVPSTGEILALVSKPTFDPNNIQASLSEINQPFFNRALTGVYAPGSTFKMITAMAALEENTITKDTLFQDTGELVIGDYRFGNWLFDEQGRTEGQVDVVKAIARSNDIFFYQAGASVGPELLGNWAKSFGLGNNWGLDDWGVSTGLVPSPAWKEEVKKERWYLGNTYHMSIGQGDVLASPLQIAVMTAAMAKGGVVCSPKFEMVADNQALCQQLNLNETTVSLIQLGMSLACQPGGTGYPFFDFSPAVGCKTGTAQHGGEEDLPHAWFTVYAPVENPEIVVTVLVEKGGQGSQVAAPIAKKALEYWFKR